MEKINFLLFLYWLLIILSSMFFGKIVNIIIYLIPEIMRWQWKKEVNYFREHNRMALPDTDKLCRFFLPGLFCLRCEKMISVKYHIPLLGLFFLSDISVCNKKIVIRHHVIEILLTIILLAIIINFSDPVLRLSALILICSLTVLTFIDADTGMLPDNITLPLLWCGLIFNIKGTFIALDSAVLGAVCGYLFLWGIYWLFKLLTNKEGMGYGDFKLLAALGAWFGMEAVPVLILLSSSFAIFFVTILLLCFRRHYRNTIAFGPFLALSGISYFLFITAI